MSETPRGRARPAPALYIITDRRATAGRPLADVIARALDGIARAGATGADVAVQLREKDLDGGALLALARELRRITDAAGAGLYVNDRADVALAAGADGVHLGGGSLSPAEVAALARASDPELGIAVSAHGAADLARAVTGGRVDFAVLGPIFDTPSKRRYGAPLGTGVLAEVTGLRSPSVPPFPLPILALGGVTPGNVKCCFVDGARGVACIRAVLEAADPASAVAAFLSEIKSF